MAGGKIVEADDALVEFQQCFEQIRADKSSHARHQPRPWILEQLCFNLFVSGHNEQGRVRNDRRQKIQ